MLSYRYTKTRQLLLIAVRPTSCHPGLITFAVKKSKGLRSRTVFLNVDFNGGLLNMSAIFFWERLLVWKPFKKQRKRTKNRNCVYRLKSTNITQNEQIAIEKACRFESDRCLHSPFFELAFLNTFLAMKKVFAKPARGDTQIKAQNLSY